jgi:hypothetical protein
MKKRYLGHFCVKTLTGRWHSDPLGFRSRALGGAASALTSGHAPRIAID